MEYCVYILYSTKIQKTYTGFTSDLINRFKSHNELAKKGWTVKGRPWIMVHVEFYSSRKEALEREKQLKGGQGRAWVKNTILTQKHIVGLLSA